VTPRACERCGAKLAASAGFCTACGAAPNEGRLDARRDVYGIAALFFGTLAAVIALAFATPRTSELGGAALYAAALLAVGAAGLAFLGFDRWRETLGGLARPVDHAWWLAAAALAIGFSWAWVEAIRALADTTAPDVVSELRPSLAALVVSTAILPALCEEWLCRGVLWSASRRALGTTATIVATAGVFALLHGLEGSLVSYPHRFVLGVLAGILRARSGSLLPAVQLHLLHNLAFVLAGE
jgi:membrane protease YdiL (CAAX protease family)